MKDVTIRSLFFPPADGADQALSDSPLIDLEGEVEHHLPKLPFGSVKKEMAAKVEEVLDVGVDQILVAGWKKYQGLRAYADPRQHPPEETVLLPLAKHTIRSAHRPHVDLTIKEVQVARLVLDVELALDLEGVVLKIQGGRIREVGAGSCRVRGRLHGRLESRVGAKKLLERECRSRQFRLAGALELGDGIAIPPPEGAVAA